MDYSFLNEVKFLYGSFLIGLSHSAENILSTYSRRIIILDLANYAVNGYVIP